MNKTNQLSMDSSILYRCSQKYVDRALDEFQIGAGQLPLLILIYENENITMNGLAKKGFYDKGTITKAIQRLEEQGYVQSVSQDNDKRVRGLQTTIKTKEVISRLYMIRRQWWETIMDGLSDQEIKLFGQLQEKLVKKAVEATEPTNTEVNIFGLQKLTLLDYPGKVASTIFTGGCNFRCPFCQNSDLVFMPENLSQIPKSAVLEFLKKRQGVLEGICISGGEPMLEPGLESFLQEIQALGFKTKLDTNGSFPDRLKELIEQGLIDMVALDVKNSPARYGETIGITTFDMTPILESVEYLKHCDIEVEFRTTVVQEFHTLQDLLVIGKWLKGAKRYVLQSFVDSQRVILPGLHGYTKQELLQFASLLQPFVQHVEVRG